MSGQDETARIAELLERLLGDADFRVAFRRDPARACREHGLDRLGDRLATSGHLRALETRESRSGLGGVLVASAMDGAGLAHLQHPPVAMQTGAVRIVAAAAHHSLAPISGYPGDGASQARIAGWMADHAERHGLPRELPVMAALVESGLHNLPGGDRASVGYFQMQTVFWLDRYPGYPDNPELQLKWFIDQALAVRDKHPGIANDPNRWGDWVADIERPEAANRWKYGARLEAARALVKAAGGKSVSAPSLLAAQTGFHGAVDGASAARSGDGTVDALKAEAQRIDRAEVPYSWGGGHLAKQAYGSAVIPLDCSGAVSRVLGLNPRVARDFESWGASGPGRRVTIFANDDHVLIEIDGHFWGTSAANPGGGAGWIPRSYLSDGYLSQFTVRHPPGE